MWKPASILAAVLLVPVMWAWQGADLAYAISGKTLTVPELATYRNWHFAGASVVPNEHNNNKAIFPGIHNVYIDPGSYDHRREKGTFRDGTIILMEVLHVNTRESESGYGYFTTGGRDVLIHIKDRRVFSGNGWAYYVFYDKELKAGKKVSEPNDPNCKSCHQAAAADDEVFVQYFPELARE